MLRPSSLEGHRSKLTKFDKPSNDEYDEDSPPRRAIGILAYILRVLVPVRLVDALGDPLLLAVAEKLEEDPDAGAHAYEKVRGEHEEVRPHERADAKEAAGQPECELVQSRSDVRDGEQTHPNTHTRVSRVYMTAPTMSSVWSTLAV